MKEQKNEDKIKNEDEIKDIIVYGRPGDKNCDKVTEDFDKAKIPYLFVHIDANPTNNQEMWAFLKQANYKGTGGISLPIVNMYGVLKVSTEATVDSVQKVKAGKGGNVVEA